MTSPALPDLCRPWRLALTLGVAELMVVLLFLAPTGRPFLPLQFAFASFLALWVALSIAVVLCGLRRLLTPWPARYAGVAAVLTAAVIAGLAMAALFAIDGNLATGLVPRGVSATRFVTGGALMAALLVGIELRYLYVVGSWQAQVEAAGAAQAQALQARIRPHFLFNSMNVIAALIRGRPAQAEEAVLDLADLFRAALGAGDAPSSLAEEIDLARRYLSIEQLRLGDNLVVEWELPPELPALSLPRLVLQPLVENAVLHGISRISGGGTLRVLVHVFEDSLEILVENPLPPAALGPSRHQHAGHAQESTRLRLRHVCGPRADLKTWECEGLYHSMIKVPR